MCWECLTLWPHVEKMEQKGQEEERELPKNTLKGHHVQDRTGLLHFAQVEGTVNSRQTL